MGQGGAATALSGSVRGDAYTVGINRKALSAYDQHCGFPAGSLPLTYLFVLANGPQLALLNRNDCPYSAAGLVHRNVRLAWKDGPPESIPQRVHVTANLADLGVIEGGGRDIEIACHVESDAGITLGQVISGFRVRGRKRGDAPKTSSRPDLPHENVEALRFETERGRVYAKLSGDWNPIHLSRVTARLFGFKRPIAHGLDMLSCIVARSGMAHSRRIEARFRRPLYLPSEAKIILDRSADPLKFSLVSADGRTLHLDGTIDG